MARNGPDSARKYRTLLASAAMASVAGIALCVTGSTTGGSIVTVAGLLGMIAGLHRFGRLGPDAPTELGRRRRHGSRAD